MAVLPMLLFLYYFVGYQTANKNKKHNKISVNSLDNPGWPLVKFELLSDQACYNLNI